MGGLLCEMERAASSDAILAQLEPLINAELRGRSVNPGRDDQDETARHQSREAGSSNKDYTVSENS